MTDTPFQITEQGDRTLVGDAYVVDHAPFTDTWKVYRSEANPSHPDDSIEPTILIFVSEHETREAALVAAVNAAGA